MPQGELRDKVIAALKTVYDPEIPVDVYELGLIYEISVFPVNNVFILMTLTSPSCPSAEVIPVEVEQKVNTLMINIYEDVEPVIEAYEEDTATEEALLQVKDFYYEKKYLERILDRINVIRNIASPS